MYVGGTEALSGRPWAVPRTCGRHLHNRSGQSHVRVGRHGRGDRHPHTGVGSPTYVRETPSSALMPVWRARQSHVRAGDTVPASADDSVNRAVPRTCGRHARHCSRACALMGSPTYVRETLHKGYRLDRQSHVRVGDTQRAHPYVAYSEAVTRTCGRHHAAWKGFTCRGGSPTYVRETHLVYLREQPRVS